MNVIDFLRVSTFISDCPNCKNGMVGNGQGTINVNNNVVKRTCMCGFNFKYNVTNGTSKTKIEKAIGEALKQM